MTRRITAGVLVCIATAGIVSAQPARFDDVVRNLRNPDPKIRLSAVRLLREARYPEAIVPLAPLVNDPVDAIQLEAIGAQLSFFLVRPAPERRRIGLVVEVRNRGGAPGAFEQGPLAVWPRPAPPAVVSELLRAVDDENGRVRLEAIYAAGIVGRAPLEPEAEERLIKALDHYDPAVRAGAARVAGRLRVEPAADVLIKAMNDSNAQVRYAAMRAIGMLGDGRAVTALTEQLRFYEKGEGAWSALDALARIAHPVSVPVFTAHLADRDPFLRRAAAEGLGRARHTASRGALEIGASNDTSAMVRAAMAYALQKLGGNYIPRLLEFLDDRQVAVQVQEYLLEFGPTIERDLIPSLEEPDDAIRAAVAEVLGEIGGEASLSRLQGLEARDRAVSEAAERAVERIRLRRTL